MLIWYHKTDNILVVVGNELFNGEGMTTANEPLEAFILSDLLRNPHIHDHEKYRPGVHTSLRSGVFPGVKTTKHGSSLEPKIHAVGLNIRYICRCYENSSGLQCQCFHHGDLSCRALYLSRNNLTSGRGLESFQNVTTLSLADNLFNHVPIELSQMTHLKRLNFAGNVMAEAMPHCRERILAYTSPRLCELDGLRVSQNEVRRAHKIVFEECINVCIYCSEILYSSSGEYICLRGFHGKKTMKQSVLISSVRLTIG